MPVHEIASTPGPKYSMIAPVPPLTVRMPATFRMTSFGEVQPFSWPVNFTPITLGHFSSHGMPEEGEKMHCGQVCSERIQLFWISFGKSN